MFKKLVISLALIFVVSTVAMAVSECDEGRNDGPVSHDQPAVDISERDSIGNLPKSCDTSWERATLKRCEGLPYYLLLQDDELDKYRGFEGSVRALKPYPYLPFYLVNPDDMMKVKP